ncbi:MAG: hypothetical protein E7637_05120 [Ruminococcaceae bacterium]|nr:hypothetical protein [Oscillospiraceae bacterium]
MDRESGFGANGAPYEYTVSEAKSKTLLFKKITLVAVYCLWAVAWFSVGLMTKLLVPFLALVPLSLWILVFLTWRYTQIEYEYSYFTGILTVNKILGSRSRKQLAKITIRDLTAVYPCDEEYAARIEAFGENKTVFAASSENAPNLYAALWTDESGVKHALYFEPNEKAIKILKYYNITAVTMRKPNA